MDMIFTRSSLRRLLKKALRNDTDVDAFLIDHFPSIKERCSNGMLVDSKFNLLLEHYEPNFIFKKLQEHDPERVMSLISSIESDPSSSAKPEAQLSASGHDSMPEAFEELVAQTKDIFPIKSFVNAHRSILTGIPHFSGGSGKIEDIIDMHIAENMKPDFVRISLQSLFSNIRSYILLINFLSPKENPFLSATNLSPVVEGCRNQVASCVNFLKPKDHYDDFCKQVTDRDTSNIQLSELQMCHPLIRGAVVVGRRKNLTAAQLFYLAENNQEANINIVTYDSLIEYAKAHRLT